MAIFSALGYFISNCINVLGVCLSPNIFSRPFKSSLRVLQSKGKFVVNLLMWCSDAPNDLGRLRVVGGGIAKIAAVMLLSGEIPVWVNL